MKTTTKEKIPKLPIGKMNVLYIKVKVNYAIGVRRPRRIVKPKLFNPIVILRPKRKGV